MFEESVAALEGGTFGFAFASGSAATATIFYALGTGVDVISVNDVYGGTSRFLNQVAAKDGILTVQMVDMIDPENVVQFIKPETKLIWIETPTNPTLRITDIEAVSSLVKASRPDIWIVVDNTFMSPYNQRPLLLGADIVVHSVTKYLNGHCDVVMGVAVTSCEVIAKRLKFMQNAIGAVPSPFDCWLAARGMKTLAVRIKAHNHSALKVAQFLKSHPKVSDVFYPGLPEHPQHELAKKQQPGGFGGMLSFRLKGDKLENSIKLTQSTRIFSLAESLGGVESLIEVPSVMTHASIPFEQRIALGITDGFVRLSCGIEDSDDLISDLAQALSLVPI